MNLKDFRSKLLPLVIVSIWFPSQSFSKCVFKGPNEILSKIKSNHPKILQFKQYEKVVTSNLISARQRPNPEFELNGTKGKALEGSTSQYSLSITQPFELGGKRSSRIEFAQKKIDLYTINKNIQKENLIIKSVLSMYRLRQVTELIKIYKEAYFSFRSILKLKRKRKSLSPEEKIEKETLALATSDYKLKLSRLISEKKYIERHINLYTGEDCHISNKSLPLVFNLKNDIILPSSNEVSNSSKLNSAQKKVELAKSKLKLEKSNSIPDIKIGPSFSRESINGKSFNSFGLTVSIDLPIFDSNAGNKASAVENINNSILKLKNIKKEADLDLKIWTDQYHTLKDSFSRTTRFSDLEKKHQRAEKLFRRGVISTSMIIEVHRQLIEFSKTRYEFEYGIIEALWNIYKLNGTIENKNI